MAPNEAGEANNAGTPAGGEPAEGQQGQQQDPTPGEGGNGGQQQPEPQAKPAEPVITKDTKIPDDHPLVKALAKANQKVAELDEARAQAAKATQLEEELSKRPTTEAMDTLKNRYDRLEAFLTEAGGPLSRALDSRTFTRRLFETDDKIEDIVQQWRKDNPTATSSAAAAAGGNSPTGKVDPNELLRAARGK